MTSNRVQCLDHGYVELLDSMGGDIDIVNAARTSFDDESVYNCEQCGCKIVSGYCGCDVEATQQKRVLSKRDAGLISFLMREKHMTPFEMVQLKFAVKAPIFVFREWHRHRTFSINEMSGRYVELPREFYVPDRNDIREQKGKAGAYYYERIEDDVKAEVVRTSIMAGCNQAFDRYEDMIDHGIAKEVARIVLPVNTYSKMVWSGDLRCLMQFLALRNHKHAQLEIRMFAAHIEKMAEQVAPVAVQAFREHGRLGQ